jgi:hypothetical protein
MNTSVIKKVKNYDSTKKIVPRLKPSSVKLERDTLYTDEDGRILLMYTNISSWPEARDLTHASLSTDAKKSTRTSGVKTKSSVFGYMPRNALRYNYCRKTISTKKELKNWKLLTDFAKNKLMPFYVENFFIDTEKKMQERILNDWKIDDTIFTTISINFNQLIKTHTDSFNTKGSLSNVLILKQNAEGGQLYLPEYDAYVPQDNGDLTVFRGEEILHGVCKCDLKNGFRASLVFYQLEQLQHCYPYLEELKTAQDWYDKSAKKRVEKRLTSKKYGQNGTT